MQNDKIIIAIDGYSSSGKSTIAKALAQSLGYIYIDTGAMYRAVTLYALRQGYFVHDKLDAEKLRSALPHIRIGFSRDAQGKMVTELNGENVEAEIRDMAVSGKVSLVAAEPFVREALVAQQQRMGQARGIVMDGRDIGTTVFPDAELKLFVTASPDIRAQRRYDELKNKGSDVTYDAILANVKERDHIDETRATSPLRKASDAIVLDTGHMTPAEQNLWVMKQYEKVMHHAD